MSEDTHPLDPPYTPAFGIVPQAVAGRENQLARHERALKRGPRDAYFTQAVIGERGVGKTVYVSVLADRMQQRHDWLVIRHQARRGADSVAEILAELPDASGRTWKGRGLRDLQRQLTVALNTGVVKVSGSVTAPVRSSEAPSAVGLLRALRTVGDAAQKRGRGVLLVIDEAQALSDSALADLGMISQTVAHAEGRPVSVTLVGTPDLSAHLLQSGSFLERMPRSELDLLSREETRLALLEPANARGVTWDEDALWTSAMRSEGYPYFVQLCGYHAWEHAHPVRGDQITDDDALAGAAAMRKEADRIFCDRWERLGPAQQQYLRAAVLVAMDHLLDDDQIPTRLIAAELGRAQTALSRVRSALINEQHLLRAPFRGEVQFTIPGFRSWLEEQIGPGEPIEDEGLRALREDLKVKMSPEFRKWLREEDDKNFEEMRQRRLYGNAGRPTLTKPPRPGGGNGQTHPEH